METMQNEQNIIFEDIDDESHEFEVIEVNDENNQITAGNPTNASAESPESPGTEGVPTITNPKATPFAPSKSPPPAPCKPSTPLLLWTWVNTNCFQPCYASFKAQLFAEGLQVGINVVPILMYELLRRPYKPCQDLPESFFVQQKKPKPKKTWKDTLFSLETLCILSLACTVFMAGLVDTDDMHSGDARSRRNGHGHANHRRSTNSNAVKPGQGYPQRRNTYY